MGSAVMGVGLDATQLSAMVETEPVANVTMMSVSRGRSRTEAGSRSRDAVTRVFELQPRLVNWSTSPVPPR